MSLGNKIAIFPGSFDPYTLGHHDVVMRALPLFDKIIISIGKNSKKQKAFSEEFMMTKLNELYAHEPKIETKIYQNLTVDFANSCNANFILRGLRNGTDLDYEKSIALSNKKIDNKIETIFLITSAEYSMINSSIVREIYKTGKDISCFLPFAI